MKKRILSLFLALALLCALLPQMGLTAHAETYSGTCGAEGDGSNLQWSFDEDTGTLTITGSGAMADYGLVDDDGITATAPWYGYREDITAVSLQEGVTSIGVNAFIECIALTSVTIPDSVTSIGFSAFVHCDALASVTIGNSVTSIGDWAFSNCSALTSVTIPESVTSIGNSAFHNCRALTSVTIPDGVTSIGYGTFYDCCSLSSVTIPDSVTSIDDGAFCRCSALTSVTIPDSVTSIGESVFNGCYALTSVTLGNGVTSIGHYAFDLCVSLTDVTIPASVTQIGWGPFAGCESLSAISVASGNADYVSTEGVLFSKEQTELVQYPAGKPDSSYEIPTGVTSIGNNAFDLCCALMSVTIPDSVTSIGDAAFANCDALMSVTIGNGVTSIGVWVFGGCTALTSVTIGNGVTSIGDNAFCWCSALTSVTIPDSVTSIGEEAFYDCTALTSVTIPASVTSIEEKAFGYYEYYSEENDLYEENRVEGFTIYGYKDTEAQRYAVENEFAFVSLQVANPFEDVQESDFYFNPVLWAVENNVTSGRDATHFAPNETVKRSEAMLFFYAAKGRPEYSITKSPFKDVKKKHWFYDAVLWAVENKITSGTDATHFSPNKTCIRSEILQFLYAAMDKPEYTIANPYSDVKDKHWYKDGAIWAYEMGLERGSNGKFKAKTPCTRAYVVTYLYRFITGKELVK